MGEAGESAAAQVAAGWAWFDRLQRPQYWLAPLVGLSEPAFRLLARRHGTHICSTEMIDAAGYSKSESVSIGKCGSVAVTVQQ